jgi:hypothetical protein
MAESMSRKRGVSGIFVPINLKNEKEHHPTWYHSRRYCFHINAI